MRRGSRREGIVQLGTFESDRGSKIRKITMSRPSQSQTAAFFGILAGALILVLTAMALTSADRPRRPHYQTPQVEVSQAAPRGLSLEALGGRVASK